MLEIDAAQLGTLELGGLWVPYIDLYDQDFVPTRLKVVHDEYGFDSSIIIKGHGAVLPQRIRELRSAGKKPLVVERGDRYYVYATPP
jgi:hypothetical protein